MTNFYEKSSPPSSIVFLTRNRSVVFHLSSLVSWSKLNNCDKSVRCAFVNVCQLKRTYLLRKRLLITVLHCSRQVNKQCVFPLLLEAWVQLSIPVKRSVDTDLVACA